MRILGIDPSIRQTGYGIIDADNNRFTLVDCGTITTSANDSMGTRLAALYDDIKHLIETMKPDEMSIEEAFYGANVKTAMVLGQARGVALLCAAQHGLPIGEYAPRKVKLAATGNGGATKEQVQYMVQQQLNLAAPPEPLDASDALAIAMCHHQQLRLAGAAQ
jgi:crossover junction endodeoxyribonuclease RuvC